MKKLTSFLLFCFFMATVTFGQQEADAPYEVVPMDEGVFTYQLDGNTGDFRYFFSDDNLEKTLEGSLTVPAKVRDHQYKYQDNKIFILFSWQGNRTYEKLLLSLDPQNGKVIEHHIPNAQVGMVNDFFILSDRMAFYGKSSLNQSMVQILEFTNPTGELITFCVPEMDIWHMAASDEFLDITATPNLPNRENQLHLMTFNAMGEKVLHVELERPYDRLFIKSARLQYNNQHGYRIVGTYSDSRKRAFTGYFDWQLDEKLHQNLQLFPVAKMESFSNLTDKTTKKKLKEHLKTGFKIVKLMEENGKLAVVSIPFDSFLSPRLQMEAKSHHDQFMHFLFLDDEGKMLEDQLYNFPYQTKRILIPKDFLAYTPTFLHQESLYFCHPDDFLQQNANLTVKKIALPSEAESNTYSVAPNIYFRSKHWKSNQVLIYGMHANNAKGSAKDLFFLKKLDIPTK